MSSQHHFEAVEQGTSRTDRRTAVGDETTRDPSGDKLACSVAALAVLACSDQPAEEEAKAVARFAQWAIDNCDGAVVTLRPDGRAKPVAWTSAAAHHVDAAQYEPQRGPCLQAMDQLQVFAVGYVPDATSWPEFRQAAETHGITSCLSVPLVARGRTLGALNLYSHRRDAFVGEDQAALTFAAVAASALAGVRDESTP